MTRGSSRCGGMPLKDKLISRALLLWRLKNSGSLMTTGGSGPRGASSDEDVPVIDAGVQGEGHARPNPGEQDEGQAGPNLGKQDKGQAGLNPGDAAASRPQSNVSTQPHPKQIDEGFTATAYSKVQENLKLMVEEQRISKLKHIMVNLIQDNKHLEERLDSHGARLYTLENLEIPQQVSKAMDEIVTDAVDWAIQASLRNRFRDLPEAYKKEILHQRIWETNSYKT
nr:hypothetical protein [Tanacetum cinerariifolium]